MQHEGLEPIDVPLLLTVVVALLKRVTVGFVDVESL